MPAYVALLRAVNVGGTGKLPMEDLAAIFVKLGCTDVRTYIQSGNVVFAAPAPLAASVPAAATAAIHARFGFRPPILTRSHAELAAVLRANPFLARGVDPSELHVAFLAERPGAAAAAALDPDRSPPDEFALVGRELYLRFPNGVGRSKLTSTYVDRTLDTISTTRNWRTVQTLDAMLASRPPARS